MNTEEPSSRWMKYKRFESILRIIFRNCVIIEYKLIQTDNEYGFVNTVFDGYNHFWLSLRMLFVMQISLYCLGNPAQLYLEEEIRF